MPHPHEGLKTIYVDEAGTHYPEAVVTEVERFRHHPELVNVAWIEGSHIEFKRNAYWKESDRTVHSTPPGGPTN